MNLPAGPRENNYRIAMIVRVTDKYGTYAEVDVFAVVGSCLIFLSLLF